MLSFVEIFSIRLFVSVHLFTSSIHLYSEAVEDSFRSFVCSFCSKNFNSSVLTEEVLCCLETICPTNSEVSALKLIHETDDPVFLFMQHLARIPDISLRLDVYNCVVSLSHRLASLKKSVSFTLETLRFLRNQKEISSLFEIILATLNYVGHREGKHPIHSFTIRFLSDLPSICGDRDIPTLMLFVYS